MVIAQSLFLAHQPHRLWQLNPSSFILPHSGDQVSLWRPQDHPVLFLFVGPLPGLYVVKRSAARPGTRWLPAQDFLPGGTFTQNLLSSPPQEAAALLFCASPVSAMTISADMLVLSFVIEFHYITQTGLEFKIFMSQFP